MVEYEKCKKCNADLLLEKKRPKVKPTKIIAIERAKTKFKQHFYLTCPACGRYNYHWTFYVNRAKNFSYNAPFEDPEDERKEPSDNPEDERKKP